MSWNRILENVDLLEANRRLTAERDYARYLCDAMAEELLHEWGAAAGDEWTIQEWDKRAWKP